MPISAAELIARVSVQGAETAERKLLGVGASSDNLAAKLGGLALGGAVVATAALLTVGAVAAHMAGDFQVAVNRLRTGAGDTQDSFNTLSTGILKVSTATGTLTGPLTQAMYLILSANQRGAQAFNTLSVAAQGATIEQAKVVDVANVLSGVMTNYGTKVFSATQYMNGLIFAVAHGKISLQDLSVAMGPIDPIAHAMGISMADVAAAMTTQTNAMIPAARAATGLRFMMQALEVPTHKAAAAMTKWGLDSVKVAEEMKVSLPGALQMIYDAAKRAGPEGSVPFTRAISDMAGGQRSLSAFTALTGEHMKDFIANSKGVTDAMLHGKDAVNGWSMVQGNFNLQLDKAHAAVDALFIKLGQALLPILGKALGFVTPLITRFADWVGTSGNLEGAVGRVASAMKPFIDMSRELWKQIEPLLKQLGEWAIKNDVAGKAVVFMKGAIVVLSEILKVVVPIIVSVVTEIVKFGAAIVERLMPKILELAAFIKTNWQAIKAVTQGLWDEIAGVIKIAWSIIKGIILIAIDLVTGQWGQAWTDFKDMLSGVWDGIKQTVLGGVKLILGALAFIPGPIGDMAKNALKIIDGLSISASDKLKSLKINAIQHSLDMQKGVLTQYETLKSGIEEKLLKTRDLATRHMLEMKLNSVNHMIDMQTKVVAHAQTMKDQVVGHSIIPDMVTGIVSWFAKLPGMVGQWIANMATTVLGGLTGLAARAVGAGANIVSSIASGILGNIGGALGNAMGAVGSFISSHLPHSPAKLGPLRDLELQGAQIVAQLSKGMSGAMPALQGQLHLMLSPVVSPANLSTPGLSAAYALRSASGGQTINVHVHVEQPAIQVDSHRFAGALMPGIVSQIRGGTGAHF